jgi:pyrimidine 5'-nucleotidase
MDFDLIFFDLDATLYPLSSGLWPEILKRINMYMANRLDIHPEMIPRLRQSYYQNYGTTLRGLERHYGVDPREYLEYVHDLPLTDYISPDPRLRSMILSIPHHRWIFTNADEAHAIRVLQTLEIEDCFIGIIDVWKLIPYAKPQYEAYQRALELVGNIDPNRCAFLDDSIQNLSTAKDMGFFTILVGDDKSHSSADRSIQNLLDLPAKVPNIWRNRDHGS